MIQQGNIPRIPPAPWIGPGDIDVPSLDDYQPLWAQGENYLSASRRLRRPFSGNPFRNLRLEDVTLFLTPAFRLINSNISISRG